MKPVLAYIKSIILFTILLNITDIHSQTYGTCNGHNYPIHGNYSGEMYFNGHTMEGDYAPIKSYVQVVGDSLFTTMELYDSKGKVIQVEYSRIHMKPMMQKIGPDTVNVQHIKNKGVWMLTIICPDSCGVQTFIKFDGIFNRGFDKTMVFFMDKKSADDFVKNW